MHSIHSCSFISKHNNPTLTRTIEQWFSKKHRKEWEQNTNFKEIITASSDIPQLQRPIYSSSFAKMEAALDRKCTRVWGRNIKPFKRRENNLLQRRIWQYLGVIPAATAGSVFDQWTMKENRSFWRWYHSTWGTKPQSMQFDNSTWELPCRIQLITMK